MFYKSCVLQQSSRNLPQILDLKVLRTETLSGMCGMFVLLLRGGSRCAAAPAPTGCVCVCVCGCVCVGQLLPQLLLMLQVSRLTQLQPQHVCAAETDSQG